MLKINQKPSLRFKGFSDAWEQYRLGDLGKTFTGLSGKSANDFGHGDGRYVTYMNVFANTISNPSIVEKIEVDNSQNQVQYCDVFFTTSSETPEEVGMSSIWLNNTENTYLNSFCFGYRPHFKFDPLYLGYLLRSPMFRKDITILAQGISRYNISKNKVMEIKVLIPSLEEQNKIGTSLRKLDNLITLHQSKYGKLVNIKKALLGKMFPENGFDIPKIRFKGFTDAWKNRALGEILKTYQFKPFLAEPNVNGKYQIIQQGDNSVAGFADGNPFENFEKVILFGDHTVSIYKPEKPFFLATDGIKILSSDGLNGDFLYFLMARYKPSPQGYTRHFTVLKAISSWITTNAIEQSKISVFLKSLDNLIILHQLKYEKLVNIKKALLEKMFI